MSDNATMKEFERAVKDVLLKPISKRADYENRKPTAQELKTKWRLTQRKKKP